MNQENRNTREEEMEPEYDIRGGVRGKHFAEYMASRSVVIDVSSVTVFATNASGVTQGIYRSFATPSMLKSPELTIGVGRVS